MNYVRSEIPNNVLQLKQSGDHIMQRGYSPKIVQQQSPQQQYVNSVLTNVQHVYSGNAVPQKSNMQIQDVSHKHQALQVVNREDIEAPWKQKVNVLTQQNQELQNQVNTIKQGGINNNGPERKIYVEDTLKINKLSGELDRANGLVYKLQNENKALIEQNNELKHVSENGMHYKFELEKVNELLQAKENYNAQEQSKLRGAIDDLKATVEKKEKELQGFRQKHWIHNDLEDQIALLTSETERLKNMLKQKQEEINEQQFRLNRQDQQLQSIQGSSGKQKDYEQLKYNEQILGQELQKITVELRRRNEEIEQMKRHQDNNDQYLEIERLNRLLRQSEEERQQLKYQYDNQPLNRNDDLKNYQLTQENDRLQSQLRDKQYEIDSLLSQLRNGDSSQLQKENQSLKSLLNSKDQEIYRLANRSNSANGEWQRRYELAQQDLDEKRNELAEAKQEIANLKKPGQPTVYLNRPNVTSSNINPSLRNSKLAQSKTTLRKQ